MKIMKQNKNYLVLALSIVFMGLLLTTLPGCGGSSGSAAPRLNLQITSPSTRATVTDPTITITGIISDPAAIITIKDIPVTVDENGSFSHPVELAYGNNSMQVRASKEGQNSVTRTLTITRNLVLDVSAPKDKSFVSENSVLITGKVSDPAARVLINGSEADVTEEGIFSSLLELFYITTTINISTVLEGVDPITKLVTVSQSQ